MNKQEQEFAEFQRRARVNMIAAVRNMKLVAGMLGTVTLIQLAVLIWEMYRRFH